MTTDNGSLLGVDLIFIIMGNTRIALQKFLSTIVPEKYPIISRVEVSEYFDDDFIVYLGVKYSDLYSKEPDDISLEKEIRNYVRNVAKFVTGNADMIRSVTFFDPDQS